MGKAFVCLRRSESNLENSLFSVMNLSWINSLLWGETPWCDHLSTVSLSGGRVYHKPRRNTSYSNYNNYQSVKYILNDAVKRETKNQLSRKFAVRMPELDFLHIFILYICSRQHSDNNWFCVGVCMCFLCTAYSRVNGPWLSRWFFCFTCFTLGVLGYTWGLSSHQGFVNYGGGVKFWLSGLGG